MSRRLTTITPGVLPRLHAGLIWVIAWMARPFNYRGVQRLSWELTRFLSADHKVAVRVAPDTRLMIPLGDGYWTKLLNRHYVYEPEVASFLDRQLDPGSYFLDCGANIGYWSLLTRNKARSVVAVEANPTTYQRLQENVQLNQADVVLVNAALWSVDGEELTIVERPREHAGASVRARESGSAETDQQGRSQVRSVTLRTLIEDHCPDQGAKIVMKLDVEGAEIAALQGAGELLRDRNVLIVYEDHGSDPACRVTQHLQDIGMTTADPITGFEMSLEQISARKTQVWKGYNFVAFFPR